MDNRQKASHVEPGRREKKALKSVIFMHGSAINVAGLIITRNPVSPIGSVIFSLFLDLFLFGLPNFQV